MILPWFGETGRRFRALEANDAYECAELHASSFRGAWSEMEFDALLADDNVFGDGVFSASDALCGFTLSRAAAGEAEILSIAVTMQERGKGLAKQLLELHMRRLSRLGVQFLFLEVAEYNEAARKLYARLGFEQVGRRADYYRHGSAPCDALVLRSKL